MVKYYPFIRTRKRYAVVSIWPFFSLFSISQWSKQNHVNLKYLQEGRKRDRPSLFFFWIKEQHPETLNRKKFPLYTGYTDVKEAACCFNIPVINVCMYLITHSMLLQSGLSPSSLPGNVWACLHCLFTVLELRSAALPSRGAWGWV